MKTKGGKRAPARKAPAAASERVFRLVKRDGDLAYLRASQVAAVEVEELEDGDRVIAYVGTKTEFTFDKADAVELLDYFEALAAGAGGR